jgi:hypothetical protein
LLSEGSSQVERSGTVRWWSDGISARTASTTDIEEAEGEVCPALSGVEDVDLNC